MESIGVGKGNAMPRGTIAFTSRISSSCGPDCPMGHGAISSHQFTSILWKVRPSNARSKPEILDLGQGFPDFEGAAAARQKAADAIRNDPVHGQDAIPRDLEGIAPASHL
jgi:hypothetical protein